MKKHLLFISLIIVFGCTISAQNLIKGIVIDKDTRSPIADVIVQYGNSSRDYVYTDSKGNFTLPAKTEEVISFQCFGYKAKTVLKSTLGKNSIIEMELSPLSLNPVIISPEDADKLLEEVMINTKKKLLTEASLSYLLHFQQNKADTLQNEIYLKYATTLTDKELKKNLKKERVPYVFNIMDIKRVQCSVTPTSELYGAEYHASHLFTFGKSINNETTRSYSSDSSYIILQIEPLAGKDGWASGEVVINKDDMTIYSMEIESVDSLLENRPYKPYMGKQVKTLRKAGRFHFAKAADRYFMKDCYTYYKFRAIDEFGNEEEISYYCDVDCRGLVDKKKYRDRRLSGYIQELFYFPDSTEREFWLDAYANDMEYLQYEFKGIAPSSNKSWFWKSLIGAGGAFGLFVLINKI